MASVLKRGKKWYISFKAHDGSRRREVTLAKTKTEANKLAAEREREEERLRLKSPEAHPNPRSYTVERLMNWWLKSRKKNTRAFQRDASTINKHFGTGMLANLPLEA